MQASIKKEFSDFFCLAHQWKLAEELLYSPQFMNASETYWPGTKGVCETFKVLRFKL